MRRCARCGKDNTTSSLCCAECDELLEREYQEAQNSNEYNELKNATTRLIAAVKQAQDITAWPVCGQGDPVGDGLAAALNEAEALIEK